jgi:hypothetical protein
MNALARSVTIRLMDATIALANGRVTHALRLIDEARSLLTPATPTDDMTTHEEQARAAYLRDVL